MQRLIAYEQWSSLVCSLEFLYQKYFCLFNCSLNTNTCLWHIDLEGGRMALEWVPCLPQHKKCQQPCSFALHNGPHQACESGGGYNAPPDKTWFSAVWPWGAQISLAANQPQMLVHMMGLPHSHCGDTHTLCSFPLSYLVHHQVTSFTSLPEDNTCVWSNHHEVKAWSGQDVTGSSSVSDD